MELKHTPGPWLVEKEKTAIVRLSPWLRIEQTFEADNFTHFISEEEMSIQGDANAKLIAAAPELLQALIAARDELAKHIVFRDHPDLITPINAAIAKATTYENVIVLPVMAKHFQNAIFDNTDECPIAKAAIDFFSLKAKYLVSEAYKRLIIYQNVNTEFERRRYFEHKEYRIDNYNEDVPKAIAANFDDTIIFNLELNEVL